MARQMQQPWQMGVNMPPAALKQDPAGLPPAAPGHQWVQVPITEKPPQPDAAAPAGPAAIGATDEPAVAPTVDPEMLAMLKHCQEPRGQFAHPSQCAKFYNCWDGFVAEQSCPGELVFSDQGPFCDYVKNVDCSARGGDPPAPTPPAQQQPGN
jgi:Chitin binding Peritrophin-A domain